MRTITRILVLLSISWTLSEVHAQEEARFVCGFNFVNAVGEPTPTILKVNGQPYRPAGYKSGALTQGGMLYAGEYVAEVENSPAKPASLKFSASRSVSPILVAYQIATQSQDGEDVKELRLMAIPNRAKVSGRQWWAIMMDASNAVSVKANDKSFELEPLKLVELGESGSMSISVAQADGSIRSQQFSPDSGGNFLVFFFETPEGPKFSLLIDEVMSSQRKEGE